MPFRPPRGLPKGPGSATYPQRHRDNMQTEGCTSKGTCPDFPAHGNGRHREAETPRRLLRTPHTPVTIERQVRHAGTGAAARPKAPRRLLRTPCAPRSLGGDLPLVNAVLLLPAVLHLGLERGNHLTGLFGVRHRDRLLAVPEGHAGEVVVDHALHLGQLAVLFLRHRGRQVEVHDLLSFALAHGCESWSGEREVRVTVVQVS
mmetsp:Transcript_17854/g.52868  ORF Transcript_17854/g.52868 Transcript_17854/m.52868 type:complete len:203 (-) Transcript_17854:137-745(-)